MLKIAVEPAAPPRESGKYSPTADSEPLRAISLDHLLALHMTIVTFTIQILEFSGLPGVTMEVTTLEHSALIQTVNK
jgi:hypothetical protein